MCHAVGFAVRQCVCRDEKGKMYNIDMRKKKMVKELDSTLTHTIRMQAVRAVSSKGRGLLQVTKKGHNRSQFLDLLF